MGKRISLRVSQSTQGAFHLSELTGQPILIVMRISLLININHKQQSNPTHYAQTRWFCQQILLENVYFISKMPGLAMVRPASSDL